MEEIFKYEYETFYNQEFQGYNDLNAVGINYNNELLYSPEYSQNFPMWKSILINNDKETFEKKLNDPLWACSTLNNRIYIYKTEDKVTIKFRYYYVTKGIGKNFYKKETKVKFYTYNFIKNSFYEGHVTNFHKKRKFSKAIRRTSPFMSPINNIRHLIREIVNRNIDLVKSTDITNYCDNILNTFLNSIPKMENYQHITNVDNRLYKLIYDSYNVKLPNNWEKLIFNGLQPKIKEIRKCKNKYIDALMMVNNFKGDKIKRVLHQIDFLNPSNYSEVVKLFGEGYILQQSDAFLKKLFEFNYYFGLLDSIELTKKERNSMFKIFELVLSLDISTHTFIDHIVFHSKINKFEPVKWRSIDLKTFTQEHLDWTELYNFYTKGDYERIYDQKFIDEVTNVVFDSEGNKYYPVLLMKSREYNEESLTQSNCVKGYITRPGSVIISLRKGSLDSKERATIEFYVNKVNKKVYLSRVQTLGRFNQRLTDEWSTPIASLDSMVRNSFNITNSDLPKINVRFGIKSWTSNSIFKPKLQFKSSIGDNTNIREECLMWETPISLNEEF